jgi:hypothetical protein
MLFRESIQSGLVSWHRESLGFLIQRIIFYSCLISAVNRIKAFSVGEEKTIAGALQPLVTLGILIFIKVRLLYFKRLQVFMFKAKNTIIWSLISCCLISFVMLVHKRIDEGKHKEIPYIFVGIPPCILLLLYSVV